jgi:hypothetical protein
MAPILGEITSISQLMSHPSTQIDKRDVYNINMKKKKMAQCVFDKEDFVLCSLLYMLFKVLKSNFRSFEDGEIEHLLFKLGIDEINTVPKTYSSWIICYY